MGKIADLLDQLACHRLKVERITEKIEKLPEAQVLLAQRRLAEAECKRLEADIKTTAFRCGIRHTIKGDTLQLVWSLPKPKLIFDKVRALLDKYGLNLADYTTQPPGWWTIRKRGGG